MATLLSKTLPLDKPTPQAAPEVSAAQADKPERLVSLDAYRGFIMLAMASGGLSLAAVSRNLFPADAPARIDESWRPLWKFLAFQTDHVAWAGCAF